MLQTHRLTTSLGSILFGLLSLLGASSSAQSPRAFELVSATDATTFRSQDHLGKLIVLHFLLKTECPFCLRYTHDIAALAQQDTDTVHVFIKPDSAAEIKQWARRLDNKDLQKLPTIFRDPEARLAKSFKIPDGYAFHGQIVHYPALVILNREAVEVFRYVGKSNSDRMSSTDLKEKLKVLQERSR